MPCNDLHLFIDDGILFKEIKENLAMSQLVSDARAIGEYQDIEENRHEIIAKGCQSSILPSVWKVRVKYFCEGGVESVRLCCQRPLRTVILQDKQSPQRGLQERKEKDAGQAMSPAIQVFEYSVKH